MSQNQATICIKCGTLTSISHLGLCFNCILAKRQDEVKARAKAYRQTPEVKAKAKAYRQTPEVKAKAKAYRQRPEVKAKAKAKAKAKYYESRKRRLTPQW